ncbi:MAG TPA: porin [Planctomycetota bacterium]|nr:porin [Planctomycetota bacterium]
MNALMGILLFLQSQDEFEKLKREVEESRRKQEELEKRVDSLQKEQKESKSLLDEIVSQRREKEQEAETIFDEGFWFVGKDDRLRIGGSGQLDGRFFLEEEDGDSNFLIRRARLFGTGVLEEKWGYMVMGRWDQQTPNLHFAWLESLHLPCARFRVGLFKEPFSMEGLHSDQYWDFAERSLGVANFLQLEDIGAMLYGKLWEDRIEYGAGVFNGRGRSTENNPDKEYAGRLVLAPFHKGINLLDNLYLGVSASTSGQEETLGGTGFQTGAGTRFWTWSSGPAAAVNDDRVRWGADLEWLYGPAAIRAEYIHVDWGQVTRGTVKEEFTGSGWFVEGACVLSGENKRRNRPVFPAQNFDPAKGTWGAWEAVARYEEFTLEKDVLQAGLATGTDKAKGYTIGVNHYPNKHMAVKIQLQHLRFDDDITVGSHRTNDEVVLFVRFQFEF